ncbi:MAG: glycosyl hydrolase family protein [Ruminococcaceae bacterium]|nr:glycosyl hydrolase family protein [Oscillospiraceae bacterium]
MAIRIDNDRILTGAMYAPFCRTTPPPMEEWDADMANMAAAGYTVAHGFAEWHDIEYNKGQFDFSQVDHFVECAHRSGIVPLINVATQNSVGFYSPRWLMEEYRGTGRGFVDSNGNANWAGQYQVPCIDEPIYQAYASRFLAEVAKHFAGDTRVGGYVLWGEPTLYRPGSGAPICYCEHTVAKFRRWLEKRYGNIEALNAAWSTEGPADYVDFAQVYPPTGWARQLGGFVSWDDWRDFMEFNLADHIKEADRIFKANGAMQPTIVEMLTGIHNNIDSWKLAECTDIIGVSCFDRPGRRSALYMSMADSMAKALGKTTFVVEARGGSTKFMSRQSPTAAELSTTLLQRVCYDTKGLMYWCWRPRMSDTEGNDFGMVRPNGKVLPRTVEVGALASKLNELAPLFNSSERRSEAAIFTSQKINHLMDAEEMTGTYTNAIVGATYLLADLHINSDFICEKEILKGSLSKYKVLILPCTYILSEECAAEIARFVEGGGRVIADYILAEKKPGGRCYFELPGAGLDKVFGIEREDIRVIEHPSLCRENTAGIAQGGIMEIIHPTTARVLEEYNPGEAIITENAFGTGSAVYFAGMMFGSYAAAPSAKKRQRIGGLLKAWGLEPYCALEMGDGAEMWSNAITTALYDKADGRLRAVLVSNTGWDPVNDRLTLPAGDWQTMDGKSVDYQGAELTLGPWESKLFYRN